MSDAFDLILEPSGKLTLRRDGEEEVADVRIRRAFPWSAPTRLVSIRNAEGKELVLIEDLDKIDVRQKQEIEKWLTATTFIPRITRVVGIDLNFGYQKWKVQTDRGPVEFSVQEREDVRFLPDGRFSIKDADGNVYELPRVEELDEASQKAVQSLV